MQIPQLQTNNLDFSNTLFKVKDDRAQAAKAQADTERTTMLDQRQADRDAIQAETEGLRQEGLRNSNAISAAQATPEALQIEKDLKRANNALVKAETKKLQLKMKEDEYKFIDNTLGMSLAAVAAAAQSGKEEAAVKGYESFVANWEKAGHSRKEIPDIKSFYSKKPDLNATNKEGMKDVLDAKAMFDYLQSFKTQGAVMRSGGKAALQEKGKHYVLQDATDQGRDSRVIWVANGEDLNVPEGFMVASASGKTGLTESQKASQEEKHKAVIRNIDKDFNTKTKGKDEKGKEVYYASTKIENYDEGLSDAKDYNERKEELGKPERWVWLETITPGNNKGGVFSNSAEPTIEARWTKINLEKESAKAEKGDAKARRKVESYLALVDEPAEEETAAPKALEGISGETTPKAEVEAMKSGDTYMYNGVKHRKK